MNLLCRSSLFVLLLCFMPPMRGQKPFVDNRLAVGLDLAGLVDPTSPSVLLTGDLFIDLNWSVDLTLGVPGPNIFRDSEAVLSRTDKWHRELALGLQYRLPNVRLPFRRVTGRRYSLRMEVFDLRQRYALVNSTFDVGVRRYSFTRARVGRFVQAWRFGVGSHVDLGERWELHYQTLAGIRRTTIHYSEIEDQAVRGTPSTSVFTLLFPDNDERQGTEIYPDFSFRLRVLYTLQAW